MNVVSKPQVPFFNFKDIQVVEDMIFHTTNAVTLTLRLLYYLKTLLHIEAVSIMVTESNPSFFQYQRRLLNTWYFTW